MSLLPGETVPLSEIDLSSPDFWLADRPTREAAFRTLRDTPGSAVLPGDGLRGLAVPGRARLLGAGPPRGRVGGQPQRPAVLLGQGLEHRRPAPGAQRVLRLDDQHGRPQALPAALAGGQGLHAQGGRQGRGLRHDQGGGRRRPHARAAPRRPVRLRRGDRRSPAARHHLRDDGHPAGGHRADLPVDERHPRRRRPRVRRLATRR